MNERNVSRRNFLRLVGYGATSLALSGIGCNTRPKKQPNILFIAIDDLRPQLGCYNHPETISPNIDKLAGQGVIFKRAYCQFPVCGPSRASLLTGLRPTSQRFRSNKVRAEVDAPSVITLPQIFRDNGYYTISNGKIFHHKHDFEQASWSEPVFSLTSGHMNTYDPNSANYVGGTRNRGPFFEAPDVSDNTYIDGQICEKTIQDLRRLKKMDTPFFLACGFIRPHLPWYAPKKYWDKYERANIKIADNRFAPENAPDSLFSSWEIKFYHDRNVTYNTDEFHKTARHGYYACVSYVDTLVGKLLTELDNLGLRENTIIVLWGDHGWNLGEHNFWGKDNLVQNSINAPLIISAPGHKSNVESDGIVEFVDIYPTLCELAGLEQPKHLEGISMLPLLISPNHKWKKAAFTTDGRGQTVITADYSYTEYKKNDKTERMLYDLKKDPDENVNAVDDPNYKEIVERLGQLLHDGWPEALP